jgi:hypothetical protein
MKLSGHNYDNDVFASLLDGLKDDVVLKKQAQKKSAPKVDFNFTQTTEDTFRGILADELRFIANELLFAAKQASVNVNGDDLRKFARYAKQEGLRGKGLERAARRYCNDLQRELAPPQGTMRVDAETLIHQAGASTIVPMSVRDGELNQGHKGGYMGMSKNPNTIWDSESLHKMAQEPEEHQDKMGDEQIAASKKAKEEFAYSQKNHFWKTLQAQLSDPQNLHDGVTPVHTQASSDFNPNVPKNAMSMLSNDRDFENLPEKTAGEVLKEQAEKRAEKKAEAKEEWHKTASAKKADNTGSFVFEDPDAELPNDGHRTSLHRSAVDKLFEGLANLVDKKDT